MQSAMPMIQTEAARAAFHQACRSVGFGASKYGSISRLKSSGNSAAFGAVKAFHANAAKSIANGGKYSAKRFERNCAASKIVVNARKNAAFSGNLWRRGTKRM